MLSGFALTLGRNTRGFESTGFAIPRGVAEAAPKNPAKGVYRLGIVAQARQNLGVGAKGPTGSAQAELQVLPAQQKDEPHPVEREIGKTITLNPGKTVEHDLAPDQTDLYEISIHSGLVVELVVEPTMVDVAVTFSGSKNFVPIAAHSPYGAQGQVPLFAVVEEQGKYGVAVHSTEKNTLSGHYRITVKELRAATPSDVAKAAAWKLFATGEQLSEERTTDSLKKADEVFRRALPLWREAGDQQGEAETLEGLANLYNNAGDNDNALKCLSESLRLFRTSGDRRGEALALHDLGSIYKDQGENQKALDHLNNALKIRQELGERATEGETLEVIAQIYHNTEDYAHALELYNRALVLGRVVGDRELEAMVLDDIGVLHQDQDEMQSALDYHTQALPLRRLLHDKLGEAQTLHNLGTVYGALGEIRKAISYLNESVDLKRAMGNLQEEAVTLNNLGWRYLRLGETQKALDCFNRARSILHAVGDRLNEGVSLNHIGSVYVTMGDQEKARRHFSEALALERAVANREWESIVLNNIGVSYDKDRQYEKALESYQLALPIKRAINDRDGEAASLANIGRAYAALGDKQKAQEHFDQALGIAQKFELLRWQALVLEDLGQLYEKSGNSRKALEIFNQALVLCRQLEDRPTEVSVLLGIAKAERDLSDLSDALDHIDKAVALIESLRTKVASQALRTSYFASVADYYDFYISLLMQLYKLHPSDHYDARALEVSERARARNLLETLTEARADIRHGVDPDLIEREQSLQELLGSKSEYRSHLLSGKHKAAEAETAEREVQELLAEYQEIEGRIRVASPRYAALTQPQPLLLDQIQHQVLDDDSLLLEYSLGEDHSYLWAITTNSIISIELPKRQAIEELVWRIYFAMREGKPSRTDSIELSRMLLGPVAQQLGSKRLLIVANGALQYIPFAALPEPAQSARVQGNGDLPLVFAHEVVSLPSASTVSILRQERAHPSVAMRRLAVIADPVYDAEDSRAIGRKTPRKISEPVHLSKVSPAVEQGPIRDCQGRLQRLPFSRREAETIVALVPHEKNLVVYGFDATVRMAQSPELGQYQYIHMAVHGCIDKDHPELSGVAFSLIDRTGHSQDGILRLHQIYNLKLNADLIVLSGCETGLGKDIKGEGLVGLTQGFMYAGSPRVVVSLWSVNDMAAAELMKRFYQGIFLKHLSAASALRAAQVEMWKQKRWRLPFYWAPFVIEGEWR